MGTAAAWVVALALAAAGARAGGDSSAAWEWDFARGTDGWQPVRTRLLRTAGGAMAVQPTGRDPQIVSPRVGIVTGPLDMLEIRLTASGAGLAQWFWRTTTEGPYGGYSSDLSCDLPIEERPGVQVLRVRPRWKAGQTLLNLRFDPPDDGSVRCSIRSIRLLRPPAAPPVALAFRFDGGHPHGWATGDGDAPVSAPDGITLDTSRPGARLVGPPIRLVPAERPYLTLDVTVPAASAANGEAACLVELTPAEGGATRSVRVRVRSGGRGVYCVRLDPRDSGAVGLVELGLASPAPGRLTLHALRSSAALEAPKLSDAPTGLAVQTALWRGAFRVPVAPARIDVASHAPPQTHAAATEYTVGMWYFAAWEPEYTWDGWKQVAERSPWRIPLLYDSTDAEMRFNGIQFYRSSNPRVVDWHVHWMREHGVNLMLWDWYPQIAADGAFDAGFFGNRALENGFLGKARLGGPPVATNRFAGKIAFATMWTNHAPMNAIGKGLTHYIVDQFFSQPNYFRVDDKPLLPVWSVDDLVRGAGGEAAARAVLEEMRAYARARGLPGVYVAAVNGAGSREHARSLGIDAVMGYNYLGGGGSHLETRRAGERLLRDHVEDWGTQSIGGQQATWARLAREFGRDYLLATMPMQNWEPTLRPDNYVVSGATPDGYREMLLRAREQIRAAGLRRFVSVEAFNEWLEGSYVEPSTQWGPGFLEAIRDVFAAGPAAR